LLPRPRTQNSPNLAAIDCALIGSGQGAVYLLLVRPPTSLIDCGYEKLLRSVIHCTLAQRCNYAYYFAAVKREDVMKGFFSRRVQLTPVSRPARDLMIALALKGVLLLTIYLLFFGPAHRLPSDAAATAAALIGAN
jgi:hypothetical protein